MARSEATDIVVCVCAPDGACNNDPFHAVTKEEGGKDGSDNGSGRPINTLGSLSVFGFQVHE